MIGGTERQLTFGDQSFVQPDTNATGALTASRVRSVASDLWTLDVRGAPNQNTRQPMRITRRTAEHRCHR